MLMTSKNTKILLIEKDKIKNKYINNGNSIYLIELENNVLVNVKIKFHLFLKKKMKENASLKQ